MSKTIDSGAGRFSRIETFESPQQPKLENTAVAESKRIDALTSARTIESAYDKAEAGQPTDRGPHTGRVADRGGAKRGATIALTPTQMAAKLEQQQAIADANKRRAVLASAGGLRTLLDVAQQSSEGASAELLAAYPHLSVLGDSLSYGGHGAEVKRSLKSMLMLARFTHSDFAGLGGDNVAAIQPGLSTLHALVKKGVETLGDGHEEVGIRRMLMILSLHDLGKSAAVGRAAKEVLNLEDHDVAIAELVRQNFTPLEGYIPDAQIALLRDAISDPAVYAHFAQPRGVSGAFNAGRHLQGEAPKRMFLDNVRGISSSDISEFILDWAGINGHTDLTGPVALAKVPPAINGTAKALSTLLAAGDGSRPGEQLDHVWQEFSYPKAERDRLGLNMDSPSARTITRLAFIGREHQVSDTKVANEHVGALRSAFSKLPAQMRDQLTAELDRDDLDLGFSPHTMAALKDKLVNDPAGPKRSMADAYEIFLRVLQRTIELTRSQKVNHPVVTTNLDNKDAKVVDAVLAVIGARAGTQLSPAEIVAQVQLDVSKNNDSVSVTAKQRGTNQNPLAGLRESSLASLPGNVWILGGLGGGGDAYQAEATAQLMSAGGKRVPATFSVRRAKSVDDVAGGLKNCELVDAQQGIFKVTKDTGGVIGTTSRLPERGVAKGSSRDVYLVIDTDEGKTLSARLARLAEIIGKQSGAKVDGIGGIDTGGDVLAKVSQAEDNRSLSTPDQDRAGVAALNALILHTAAFVWGAGIDTPPDYPTTLRAADASFYTLNAADKDQLQRYYSKTGLGVDDTVFSKTSLAMRAMSASSASIDGFQFVEGLPLDKRLDKKNPWLANIDFGSQMNSVIWMEPRKLLAATGGE